MWNFTTQLKGKEVDFYKNGISYSVTAISKIKWSIEPEIRDWGIKGLPITIPDQDIDLIYELDNGDEEEITIKMRDVTIEHGMHINYDNITDSLEIRAILIDLARKVFSVEF